MGVVLRHHRRPRAEPNGHHPANDGTTTASTTFAVTVNNVAPTATFNAPASVNEGSPIALSLSAATDASSADLSAGFTYAFDCGSGYGSAGTTASASCATTDSGSRTVKGKVLDKDGGATEYTATVTVNNVAPSATFNAPASVNEGSNIALSLSSPTDPSSADTASGFQYAFDCGSGSFSLFGTTSTFVCPTTDNGNRTVRGQIRDKDLDIRTYSASVAVNNVAPTATFNAPISANEGSPIALSLTSPSDASSVDAASLTYAFDCGLGAGYGAATSTATASCPTTDNGSRAVKGKVLDKDGGATEYTATVTVNNVAPTATFTAPASVNEGSNIGLSLSGAADISAADQSAGFTYAFDCGSGYGSFSGLTSASCSTNDNGSRTVKGKVQDKDGGTTEYTTTVTIINVAPTATFNAPASVNEGSNIALSLSCAVRPVFGRCGQPHVCLRLRVRIWRVLRHLEHELRDDGRGHAHCQGEDPRQGQRRDGVHGERHHQQRGAARHAAGRQCPAEPGRQRGRRPHVHARIVHRPRRRQPLGDFRELGRRHEREPDICDGPRTRSGRPRTHMATTAATP